ncbi:MAG: transposase [Endomicrobium sp.]|nr:transposase [Endomicrobium sp.]
MKELDTLDNQLRELNIDPDSLPLPGHIAYQHKEGNYYGVYSFKTFKENGKVSHKTLYLGKVISKHGHIFYNRSFGGQFTFSVANGIEAVPRIAASYDDTGLPRNIALNFGDVWMIDQVFKQSGLDRVMENVAPQHSDTFKALVCYRLIENDAYCYAARWYQKSYASILYPEARLDSPRISEFQALIGQDANYNSFYRLYLETITHSKGLSDKISVPVLIDSTGLQNDIKSHWTAISNHCGDVNNEMRLIYVVDKNTKFPLFFRFIAGNIIDNSTLITTLNMLIQYNIDVELVIIDAGYYSVHNLIELISNNINFLTRMNKNRKEYKLLMEEHGGNLKTADNTICFGKRVLFGKKVPFSMYDTELFAYVLLDHSKRDEDTTKAAHSFDPIDLNDTQSKLILEHKYDIAGKFILLSNKSYDIRDILPLYYTRQEIEQVFDISKTYATMLPLRGHKDETIRGIILLSFMATAVYSLISSGLTDSKKNAHGALKEMKYSTIHVYENSMKILEELTAAQKDIFIRLKLEDPVALESGNSLKKESTFPNRIQKKRGRPKGSTKNDTQNILHSFQESDLERKGRRGRPKGSKNKVQKNVNKENSLINKGKRSRGRPKGSKNKVQKDLNRENSLINIEKRSRGRPKGSKNKVKRDLNK